MDNIDNKLINNRCYIKNPYPCYTFPKVNMRPPKIICAMRKAVKKNSPSQHPLWRITPRYHAINHKLLSNDRKINIYRCRAIDAIMECIATHVNLMTSKVFMTLGQISDACGLTTYNAKGKPCYSRASRAINEHIEAIGAIYCERIWDKTTNSYIPNIIWVTEIFFILIDFNYKHYLIAQKKQLNWNNKKLLHLGENPLSLKEAKSKIKCQHIKKSFKDKIEKKCFAKQLRKAKKLLSLEPNQAKAEILNDLIKIYTKEELINIGYVELKNQVDKRYFSLKQIILRYKAKINDNYHYS